MNERGRVCSKVGCGTTLSIYNDTSRCALHAGSEHYVSARVAGDPMAELKAILRRPFFARRRAS